MNEEIPVVDVTGLTSQDPRARVAVAREIGTACRSIGFFAIQGHGIPASRIDDAFAAARAVFALPPEAKRELAIGLHGHNRGYVGMGVEALDEHTAPDLKEAYNLVWTDGGATRPPNVWPPIAGWQERTQAYFDAVLAVVPGNTCGLASRRPTAQRVDHKLAASGCLSRQGLADSTP